MTYTKTLFTGIADLASPPAPGRRRGKAMSELTRLTDAAIAVSNGIIDWVGRRDEWTGTAATEVDLGGRAVIPGLTDPHTHTVWAGDRFEDFEARAAGVGYEEILARGGGIRSTVRNTAAASLDQLVALAAPRVAALMASGATTIEIKSGYGFEPEAELRSLKAIELLRARTTARLKATLLIHLPPDDEASKPEYLATVCNDLIPTAAKRGLAGAVDVFIEQEAWSAEDAAAIFRAARAAGMAVKAHVDQFHPIGGIACCIEHHALSADHLEASGEAEIEALAKSDVVATLLPGVTLHLGIAAAPGRKLIDAGAIVAVGTDLNPGSSPLHSTQEAMALAVRINGLSPAEALTAATCNASAALGVVDSGALAAGARADFLVLADDDWRSAIWTLGSTPVARVFIAGSEVAE